MAFKLRNPFAAKTVDKASPELMETKLTDPDKPDTDGGGVSDGDGSRFNPEPHRSGRVAAGDIDGDGAAEGKVVLGGIKTSEEVDAAGDADARGGAIRGLSFRAAGGDVNSDGSVDDLATDKIIIKDIKFPVRTAGDGGAVTVDHSETETSGEGAQPGGGAAEMQKLKTKSNQSNDRLGQEDGPTAADGDVNSDGSAEVVQYNESDLLADGGPETSRTSVQDFEKNSESRAGDADGGVTPETGSGLRTVTKTSSNIQNNRMEGEGAAGEGMEPGIASGDPIPASVDLQDTRLVLGTTVQTKGAELREGSDSDGDGLAVDGARKSGSVIMQDRVADGDGDGDGVSDEMATTTMQLKTKTKSNQSNDRLGQEDGPTGAPGDGDLDGDVSPTAARIVTKTSSNIQNNRMAGDGEAAADDGEPGGSSEMTKTKYNEKTNESSRESAAGAEDDDSSELERVKWVVGPEALKKQEEKEVETQAAAADPAAIGQSTMTTPVKWEGPELDSDASEMEKGTVKFFNEKETVPSGGDDQRTGPVRIDNTPARMSTNREAAGASDAGTAGDEPSGIAIGDPGVNGNLAPSGDAGEIAIDHEGVQRANAHEATHTVQQDTGAASREVGEQKKWLPANFREQSTAEDDEGPSTLLDFSAVSDGEGAVAIRDLDADGVPAVGAEGLDQDADGDAVDLDDMIADS